MFAVRLKLFGSTSVHFAAFIVSLPLLSQPFVSKVCLFDEEIADFDEEMVNKMCRNPVLVKCVSNVDRVIVSFPVLVRGVRSIDRVRRRPCFVSEYSLTWLGST